MTRHILVPIDDSEQSDKALEYAIEEYPDERLTVLHVTDEASDETVSGYGVDQAMVPETFDEHAEDDGVEDVEVDVLERARQTGADRGVDVEIDLETGDAARTIVEYIDAADVDHVVMGSHGRSGTSRILYGSVAEDVTRRSSVPVTIVR